MRFGVRSKAVEKLEDAKANLISVRRIIFTPNVDVKDELKNTSRYTNTSILLRRPIHACTS